jgi:Putative ABC exporter
MLSALLYLQYHTVRNRTLMRLKRLRQPKYLLGGIVGAVYFYFYFIRYLFGVGRPRAAMGLPGSGVDPALLESIGALVFFIALLLAWLIPHQRAALAFSEAEVAFLFPAPLSRRALIHFKLLRSQVAILFTTLVLVLVSNRFRGNLWVHAAGWWLILSTLNLHILGSSFARTMLLERGITTWKRRVAILGLLLTLAIAVGVWTARALPGFDLGQLHNVEDVKDYARQVLLAGPIPYVTYPCRLVVRPFLAPNTWAFLAALGPALLILALHYAWVARSDVAFEEASVEASSKLAEKVAAVRSGNWQMANQQLKRRRPPFALEPLGAPAVALLWKNLISAGQAFRLRTWLMLALMGLVLCMGVGQGAGDFRTVLGMVAAGFILWSLLLGPQLLRQDFRQDLALGDVLKMYPLRGWQVALGEVLAPAVILTLIQWFLVLSSLALVWHAELPAFGRPARAAVALGAALLLPVLNVLIVQIPNAAVLLFPSWFQTGKDGFHGIEATGQRLISMLAQLVVFSLACLPAALVFVIVLFVAKVLLGLAAALALAALGATGVLTAETAVGLLLLGRLFERLDLSAEQPA